MTRRPKHSQECDAHNWNIKWVLVEDNRTVLLRCNDLRCRVEWRVSRGQAEAMLQFAPLEEMPR